MRRPLLPAAALSLALLGAAGCATPAPLGAAAQARLATLLPADALLLGEQHDAPAHQQLQRQAVQWLAARGELAALALEMAEQGRSTAGLPRDASEADVQHALAWRDAGWPWKTYRLVVMAAVRAARQPGRTVLLVAGNGHVHRALGVPLHLPPDLTAKVLSAQSGQAQAAIDSEVTDTLPAHTSGADLLWPTPPVPPRDYCAELRRATRQP